MENSGLLVRANHGISSNKFINNCCILCRDSKIYAIGGKSAFQHADYSQILEVPNSYVIPGFIDSHIYGFQGYSFLDSKDGLEHISKLLVQHGCNYFFTYS